MIFAKTQKGRMKREPGSKEVELGVEGTGDAEGARRAGEGKDWELGA